MAKVQVDFWEYEGAEFAAVVDSLKTIHANKTPLTLDGRVLEVRNIDVRKRAVFGHIRKIQQKDLPQKSTIGGDDEDLGLAANQGLGYRGFFALDAKRSWLLWIGSRSIGGPNVLRQFLSQGEIDIDLGILLQAGALERMHRHADAIRSFAMRIAYAGGPIPRSVDAWDRQQLQSIKDTGAHFLDLTFGIDLRRDRQPLKSTIFKKLKGFLARDQIKAAKVSFMPEEHIAPIDLLQDRVTYSGTAQSGLHSMDQADAYRILSEALSERAG